ncbi:acid phosphatase [Sebaldella termitidis]|uniref:acid phosphatase n=1 Tax=Sebaldella termitidis TaxID=826 RepID=UPI003EB8F647
MKKRILTILILLFSTAVTYAADDVKTKPDLYFLEIGEVVDSYKLLPPPPEVDSIAFLNDKAQYDKGKLLRNTPRGKQAYNDAHVSADGVPQAFSEAFGIPITQKTTPEIYKLLQNFREDAGDLSTRGAKVAYMRIRPFAFFEEHTCRPDDEKTLSKNGSYPSGHTAIGWAAALVLSEINPERQDEIMTRGYEMGQSRVICGYHWQSDIDAARVVASAVVAKLHSNQKFNEQLNKAKEEFRRISVNTVK